MTPSKKRRMGKEAFSPGCDPMDVQPFKTDSWGYRKDLKDFLDGWKEAEKEYSQRPDTLDKIECPVYAGTICLSKPINLKKERIIT